MKVRTHVKLGELSLIQSINTIPKGFSKFAFNFGLVMADQCWLVKTHPHFMKKSIEYIYEKIEKLLYIKEFNVYHSLQLGIVIHYLCDFCCHSHVSGSIGNIPYHLKYERELQKYVLEAFNSLKNEVHNKSKSININLNNIASIKALINNKLLNYTKGKASYHWDIKHCIEISSIICSTIFKLNPNFATNAANTIAIT